MRSGAAAASLTGRDEPGEDGGNTEARLFISRGAVFPKVEKLQLLFVPS